jgi:hypothetical protein
MHIKALMARATFDLSLGTSIQLRLKTYCALKAYILLSVTTIAKNLGMSRQLAQFHFKKHVLGKNLIEGYEVFVMRYGETPYVMVLFITLSTTTKHWLDSQGPCLTSSSF